ncbi:DUF5681 domain-containing protein [Providencia heimbachae]|uniref:DUF5681 domain-containing protein n=1 Tax=Providencia heimbachae ATCC 35613 TaxID=1354272 RepID=A0A1B7K0F2_9GAMM|nr:DUF5681 domain-containing protein [Providencia heimbachae]OAT53637.1 hypothetical protein M998_0890 [Providencia heimbachae ATCC 35613]SQH13939.1 Uncharacterised protein [Providencia heimbachae]
MSKHPTRWQKGQSGNPSGRPSKGAEIRRNLMDMTPQAIKAILSGIESGDATCLKIWADRCDPVSKSTIQPVEFLCDTTDLSSAALSVVSAISQGLVPPDVGTVILKGIADASKIIEVESLQREVEALKEAMEEIKNDNS